MSRSIVRAGLGAVLLLAITAGTALAHECYNVNRSAQGNAGAAGSAAWLEVQIAWLFADAHHFLPIEPMTEEQIAEAVAKAEEAGIPTSAVILARTTIGWHSAAFDTGAKAIDQKGIDWFFAAYGDTLIGIALEVGTPIE
jgi:hypothetical protein